MTAILANRDKKAADAAANSYVAWLADAGVDYEVSASPSGWLDIDGIETQQQTVAAEPISAPLAAPQSVAENSMVDASQWPQSADELISMFRNGAPLPGNHYGGKTALPKGHGSAKWLLLSDLPSRTDVDSAALGTADEGALLNAMMAAAGVNQADIWLTALATTRPATGALPESDLAILAEFVRHQIRLIGPEKLVIFGSSACKALLGADLMQARGNLLDVNDIVQEMAAVTTFHPRTLLKRPQMKAQAWSDLQVLL